MGDQHDTPAGLAVVPLADVPGEPPPLLAGVAGVDLIGEQAAVAVRPVVRHDLDWTPGEDVGLGNSVSFSPLKSGNKSNTPPASTVAGTGFAGHCNPSS